MWYKSNFNRFFFHQVLSCVVAPQATPINYQFLLHPVPADISFQMPDISIWSWKVNHMHLMWCIIYFGHGKSHLKGLDHPKDICNQWKHIDFLRWILVYNNVSLNLVGIIYSVKNNNKITIRQEERFSGIHGVCDLDMIPIIQIINWW